MATEREARDRHWLLKEKLELVPSIEREAEGMLP